MWLKVELTHRQAGRWDFEFPSRCCNCADPHVHYALEFNNQNNAGAHALMGQLMGILYLPLVWTGRWLHARFAKQHIAETYTVMMCASCYAIPQHCRRLKWWYIGYFLLSFFVLAGFLKSNAGASSEPQNGLIILASYAALPVFWYGLFLWKRRRIRRKLSPRATYHDIDSVRQLRVFPLGFVVRKDQARYRFSAYFSNPVYAAEFIALNSNACDTRYSVKKLQKMLATYNNPLHQMLADSSR